ncbi:glutamate 5-kinase [Klebsiella pneumoniae]|nr:glutamate 5-kinase [Klebsiella pneumoniae]
MGTKLQAADVACRAGIDTIIAAGNRPDVIGHAMAGLPVGTCFHAQESLRWRTVSAGSSAAPPAGEITVDAGATQAILERGSSLLPKGIKIVSGNFSRGEVIRIRNSEGRDIAHASAATTAMRCALSPASTRSKSMPFWAMNTARWPSTAMI